MQLQRMMAVNMLTPFNLVKGALNAGLALAIYERLAAAVFSARSQEG